MDYLARLVSRYQWTRDYVLYELPSVQGWAFVCWSIEAEPMGNWARATDGYIAAAWQSELYH